MLILPLLHIVILVFYISSFDISDWTRVAESKVAKKVLVTKQQWRVVAKQRHAPIMPYGLDKPGHLGPYPYRCKSSILGQLYNAHIHTYIHVHTSSIYRQIQQQQWSLDFSTRCCTALRHVEHFRPTARGALLGRASAAGRGGTQLLWVPNFPSCQTSRKLCLI